MSEIIDPAKPLSYDQIRAAAEEKAVEATTVDPALRESAAITEMMLGEKTFILTKKITGGMRLQFSKAINDDNMYHFAETLKYYVDPSQREEFLAYILDPETDLELDELIEFSNKVEEVLAARPKKR